MNNLEEKDAICTGCGCLFSSNQLISTTCRHCNDTIVHTDILALEGFYITELSNSPAFFLAMNELKKTNKSEYLAKVENFKKRYELLKQNPSLTKHESVCTKCGSYFIREMLTDDVCEGCGGKIVHTDITVEDAKLIKTLSKEPELFLAINDLKHNDIITYHTKISELKAQKERAREAARIEAAKPKCPKCGSKTVSTGARGAHWFWGFIGAGKTVNRCGKCGFTWNPR